MASNREEIKQNKGKIEELKKENRQLREKY